MARDRKPAPGEVEEAPPPSPTPAPSRAEAVKRYREAMRAAQLSYEKTLGDSGGRRDLLAAPELSEVAKRDAGRAANPLPPEPSDEELGIGAMGIPERRVSGLGAAWNFTRGPILIYQGPKQIGEILELREPVVLVARYIPEGELKKIDRTRIRGFVLEQGSLIDPVYWFLRDENRAAVVGAKGAVELCSKGEIAIVDGCRGVAYFGPTKVTSDNYDYLRKVGVPPEDKLLLQGLRQMAGALMGTKIRLGEKPPFEFPEQERLLDVARRARAGTPITKEDDEWMKTHLLQGMPTPEQLLKRAKEAVDKEKLAEAEAEEREKKANEGAGPGADRGGRAGAGRPVRGAAAAEEKPAEKPAEPEKPAEKPASRERPAEPEKPMDAAAARKAAREAEMAAAQAARARKHDKDEPAKAPEREPKKEEPPEAGEPFDPLGEMV